jgi:hypothetical protein
MDAMTYTTKQSATKAAAELNLRQGYPHARVFETARGWMVIASKLFGANR